MKTTVLCRKSSLLSPSSYTHPVQGSWLCQTEMSNKTKVHNRYCAGRHPKLLGLYSIHRCAGLVFPSSSPAFQNHMFLSGQIPLRYQFGIPFKYLKLHTKTKRYCFLKETGFPQGIMTAVITFPHTPLSQHISCNVLRGLKCSFPLRHIWGEKKKDAINLCS